MWLFLAFLTALCEALKDVFSKISLRGSDPYIVALAMRLFAMPFLLPLLFFIEIPELGSRFYLALLVGGGMNIIITIIYLKAIEHTELSLAVPMVTFTPLFLLITSPLILGELPDASGIMGVMCIVLGSYFLHFSQRKKGWLSPFKALLSEKGPRLMLLVAFLWSITANIDKVGIQNSSAMFWVVSINAFLLAGMIPVVLLKSRKNIVQLRTKAGGLFLTGLFAAFTLIFQMLAIQMALVAYVISVKRTSALWVVIFGALFFGEKGFKNRLLAVLLMLLGVMLISVF